MAIRRRRAHPEHESHERWLVSYADFITLLFAFFTVLYATSQTDLKKQEEFEKSIKKQFTAVMSFGSGTASKDPTGKSLIPPAIDGFPPMTAGPQEVQDHVERALKDALQPKGGESAIVGLHHDTVGVSIQMAASHLFQTGSAELRPESAKALDQLGHLLKESGRRLIVEGHTDNQPIHTSEFPSNWELSAARATKIVRYLIARQKIAPELLVPVAYADQKPLVPNSTDENRARNRRIEIKIVTGNEAL